MNRFDIEFLSNCPNLRSDRSRYVASIKEYIKNSIIEAKDEDLIFDASKIMINAFPVIDNSIFISHSHIDISIINGLNNYLKKYTNYDIFIDSFLWDSKESIIQYIVKELYSKYRMKNIKEICCKVRDSVDIMLINSIEKVMRASKMICLVNSDNYILNKIDKRITYSPWIYHEIEYAKMLNELINNKNLIHSNINESIGFLVAYPVNDKNIKSVCLDGLIEIIIKNEEHG